MVLKYSLRIFIIFLLLINELYSGDFIIIIADKDNNSKCALDSQSITKTSKEVGDSLVQYFSGHEPDIGILHAAFANGHLRFCGVNELNYIMQTLKNIEKIGTANNKRHLSDFILMVEKFR